MENQIRTFSFLLTEIETERETQQILSCYAAAKKVTVYETYHYNLQNSGKKGLNILTNRDLCFKKISLN